MGCESLPEGWKQTTFGSVAKFVNGDRSKNYPTHADRVATGVPFINTGHIEPSGRLTNNGMDYITRESFDRLRGGKVKQGDIVYCLRGSTIGKTARNHFAEGAIASSLVIVRATEHACQDYLYFYLSSPFGQQLAGRHDNGSAQPNLSVRELSNYPLTLPPLSEQRAISQFLGLLDDRIALLRETNVSLEAITQALFKSSFVDFDPVRARLEGRAPEGMDETIARLFPDSFEESELGLVPRGWRVMPIGDAVEAVGGATPDTKTPAYWEPAVHCWTTPKDLSGIAAPVLLNTERKLSDQGLAKIGSGSLPAGTLLLSSRAPIGYLALAQVPLAINQGYIAMPPGGLLPPLYMLFWCRQNMDNIKGRANGSTFMEISKKAFRPIPALVPPPKVVQAFTEVAGALFDRLIENEKQAQTLAILRDTLLPRLISGQLRIPEAEAQIEALAA